METLDDHIFAEMQSPYGELFLQKYAENLDEEEQEEKKRQDKAIDNEEWCVHDWSAHWIIYDIRFIY